MFYTARLSSPVFCLSPLEPQCLKRLLAQIFFLFGLPFFSHKRSPTLSPTAADGTFLKHYLIK
jgi:hypothetical protein